MQNLQIFFSSIFLTKPFLLLMFQSLFIALITRVLFYNLKESKFNNYIFIPLVALFSYYFGITISLKILYLLITLSLFNHKYVNNWIVSFFILIETYIVLGILSNPTTSLIILFIIGLFLILTSPNKILSYKIDFISTKKFIYSLNIVELFILILSFVMGSMPQNQFDAAHANLYNAKTYITTNSLSALPENTSSIFPQNAILYYAFFYQLGQERALQFAYILPVLIVIYSLHFLKINYQFITPLLLTPIFLFEASSGYYDLLITSLITYSATILITKNIKFSQLLMSTFLIGFTSASKYFPIFLFCLPTSQIFLNNFKNKQSKFILMLLVVIFPLSLWLIRSYTTTNNPVFPFLQNVFPTPNIWDKNDILENNPMIKTTVNIKQWTGGAFIYYPIITYYKTTSFMEALPHYTTIVYILLLPFQIIIAITIFSKIFKRKKLNQFEIILICLFFTYYFTGFITRYYRYLWPTQFALAFFSMFYIQQKISKFPKLRIIVLLIFICIIPLNFQQVFITLQSNFNFRSHIFKPNYYHTSTILDNPITVINQLTNNNTDIKILDASKYMLGRFNFSPRVFQCNWYWYDKVLDILKHGSDKAFGQQILNQFSYIITNNPPAEANNLCLTFLLQELPKHKKIYQDQYYQIFQVKK